MLITQSDSRTIRVLSDTGVVFYVPYSFFWNGHDRQAESVVLDESGSPSPREAATRRSGAAAQRAAGRTKSTAKGRALTSGPCAYDVRAFFLFGEIRDRITRNPAGITLARTWSVKTPGALRLSIDIEFDAPPNLRCHFPGVYATQGLPPAPLSFLGQKTSYPASLIISMGKNGVLLFSKAASSEGSPAGIGICSSESEDEPSRLHVELRFPGVEEPSARIGPRPPEIEEQVPTTIESPGSLDQTHELSLAFAPTPEIHLVGAAAVFQKLNAHSAGKPTAEQSIDLAFLADAVKGLLATHLWQGGGVIGLRETPASTWISSSAGLGLAVVMRKLFPAGSELQETALRLADFSLKGQLPSGFFFEGYNLATGEWGGVKGEAERTLLSLAQSSCIAELALTLARDLAKESLPHEKYFLAGQRFVELFLDEKARLSMPGGLYSPGSHLPVHAPEGGLEGLELFFPMALVHARTGRDRYKKALDLLARRFSSLPWDPFTPPSSREGRDPDAAGAFLAARLFVAMRELGYRPAEPPASSAAAAKARAEESVRLFASLLVQWIRMHVELPAAQGRIVAAPQARNIAPLAGRIVAAPQAQRAFAGCLVDSFVRQRVIFAGNEASLLLLRLAALASDTTTRSLLKAFARLCLQGAREAPPGTSFYQHTRWDSEGKPGQEKARQGPVDSRRFASEILAGIRIAEKHPTI